MNFKTIKKGNLTIVLDLDYLSNQKTSMLESFDYINEECVENITNNKNKVVTKADFEDAIDRLYQLALDIIDNKLNIDIFEYLPLTKAGIFHRTSSTLLATSNMKDVWNGDYFQMKMMDLRLVPVSYAQKIDPFLAINQTGNIFGQISGDGTIAYIELDWFSRKDKDEPIFDEMNNPKKVEKTRNKYLKVDDIKPGYTYFDAKGNEFLYIGQLYVDGKGWFNEEDCTIYKNKKDYLNSKKRKDTLRKRKNYEASEHVKYKGEFFYLKMTKKNENLIKNSANIGELIGKFIDSEFWDWYNKFKNLDNPLKVISEGRKVIDEDLGDGFYYAERKNISNNSLYKDFFYIEKAE